MTARRGRRVVVARIGAPGRHMVQNALAVLGAADLVGADIDRVALALGTLPAPEGRGQRHMLAHGGGSFTLIDESYNANPASMKAALDLLDATPLEGDGRRIAVLGDMLELGAHSEKLHADLSELIVGTGISHVLLGGPHMKALAEVLPSDVAVVHRDEADDLGRLLIDTVQPDDVIMVKSSKGIGFSRIVAALLNRFPAHAGH
jgi:UDP-N-acetylmuramoyl-tripeptide--D-alanyl-D-alanine ligase